MKTCEHKQISSLDKTILEEQLDLAESQGWEVKSLKIDDNKKEGGLALFVADLVRHPIRRRDS